MQTKTEARRFAKFAVVGLSGLVIDVTVLNLLKFSGVSTPVAVAVGFLVAVLNNFYWNRRWVYPETRAVKKRHQLPLFMMVNSFGLLINEAIFYFFEVPFASVFRDLLVGNEAVAATLGLNFTKGVGAVIVMVWNFAVNRLVTFRNAGAHNAAPVGTHGEDGAIESAL